MKFIKSLRRSRWLIVTLVLASAVLASAAVWRAWAVTPGDGTSSSSLSEEEKKQKFHQRLRRGVGSEVRFANPGASDEKVKESVDSVAAFIYQRADLKMSDETKNRLAKAEKDVLKGKSPRLSVDELTDTFTDIVTEQVATLTDEDIDKAINTYRANSQGEITSRASGKWDFLSRAEFVSQVEAAREWSRNGDAALRAALRPMVEGEVKDRVTGLREALPEQFGQAETDGVTPAQAVLIAYSVAADDPLSDSQSDLKELMVRQRMSAKQTKEEQKLRHLDSGKPYGVNGFFYSSPVHRLLNKAAVDKLLARGKGGR
jgi:hypothetical protein